MALASKVTSYLQGGMLPTTMRFEVTIGDRDLGSWSHCSGLTVKFENKAMAMPTAGGDAPTTPMTVVPGQPTFDTVKLKRALTESGAQKVQDWLRDHAALKATPTTARIKLVDPWGEEVVSWTLGNVMPARWTGPDMDGTPSSKQVALEQLELSHDGFLDTSKVGGRFDLTINGESLGSWSQCDGLGVTFDNKDVYVATAKGPQPTSWPGRATYGELTLKRPMAQKDAEAVQKWLGKHTSGPTSGGAVATITVYDSWGKKLHDWSYQGVIPKGWSGPSLDASTKQAPVECLKLSHQGFLDPSTAKVGGGFELTIDDESLGTWTTLDDGLEVKFENRKVPAADPSGDMKLMGWQPGRPAYSPLKFKRLMVENDSKKLQTWLQDHAKKPKTQPSTAKVTLRDPWGKEIGSWTFHGVIPVEWKGPKIEPGKAGPAEETLKLDHIGFLDPDAKIGGGFAVLLGAKSLGSWSKVKGLTVEFPTEWVGTEGNTSTISVPKGPPRQSPVTLERPLDPSQTGAVQEWLNTPADKRRQSVTITVTNPWGETGDKWVLKDAMPTKWVGPSLDVTSMTVPVETLVIEHNGFEYEPPKGGAAKQPVAVLANKTGTGETNSKATAPNQNATLEEKGGGKVTFAADPRKLTVSRTARYLTVPNASGSKTVGHGRNEYRGSGAATLAVEADLLGPGDGSKSAIDDQTKLLQSWMVPSGSSKAPALLTFDWCSIKFQGYLGDLQIDVGQFGSDDKASRASVSFTLREEPNLPKKQNPTSGGPPDRRVHVLCDGETLQSIAFREYGDAAAWRMLADANGIDDPLRVAAGTQLLIPPAA